STRHPRCRATRPARGVPTRRRSSVTARRGMVRGRRRDLWCRGRRRFTVRADTRRLDDTTARRCTMAMTDSNHTAPPRPFIFDVAAIEGQTNEEMLRDQPEAEFLFGLLGKDLLTRVLVQTPELSVYHETAKPGEAVGPHRHGTYQVNYVLRGE